MRIGWKLAALSLALAAAAGAFFLARPAGANGTPGPFTGNFRGNVPWKYYPFTSESEAERGVDSGEFGIYQSEGYLSLSGYLYVTGSGGSSYVSLYGSGGAGRFHATGSSDDGDWVVWGTLKGAAPRRVLKVEGRVLESGAISEFKATMKEWQPDTQ